MRRREFCGLAAMTALHAGRAAAGQALTLSYSALSPIVWPVFIAEQAGCFRKYGLSVNPVLGTDPAWVALLARGEAVMGIGGLQQMLPTAAQTHSLVAVGAPMNKSTMRLVANKDIASGAALKGKRIAMSVPGDALYGFVIALLKKFGLSASDVELIPVGPATARRAAALAGGRADAALLTAQASFRLEAEGYRVVADLAEYGDIITSIGYWVRPDETLSGRATLQSLIQAMTEGVAQFYADKDSAIKAYLAYDKESSAAEVARVYDLMAAHNVFERIPYVLADAVAAADPEASGAQGKIPDFHASVDNSIVDRLVKDGFFAKIFGAGIQTEQNERAARAYR